MESLYNSPPELGKLLAQRLTVVRALADSLEAGREAFARNDAYAIVRGAAHQAELCRRWSQLEEELRAGSFRRQIHAAVRASGVSPDTERSAQLGAEWLALSARIRYLTRVHWSLLRHMQRTLVVWNRVIASDAPTYTPAPVLVPQPVRPSAGG